LPRPLSLAILGEGRSVSINSQGFRSRSEYSKTIPEGKIRIVCSGDSYTFGKPVGNDSTWTHRLSVLNPKYETVNMGVDGYGIDQTYLLFKRNMNLLDYDIHLFCFIFHDFKRMRMDRFVGYSKPYLTFEEGNK